MAHVFSHAMPGRNHSDHTEESVDISHTVEMRICRACESNDLRDSSKVLSNGNDKDLCACHLELERTKQSLVFFKDSLSDSRSCATFAI